MTTTFRGVSLYGFADHISTRMLRPLKRHVGRLLDLVLTEYCFRLQRQPIRQVLESTRKLPQNLHLEGTNICNAKCVFCAYP